MKDEKVWILIADKDSLTAKKLETFLSSKGYGVMIAASSKALLEKTLSNSIHLLILDVKLEDICGYELIPHIRKTKPEIPIIMTSSRNSLAIETSIRDMKVFYYCLKPYDEMEIQLAVKAAIEMRGNKYEKDIGGR